MTLMEDRLCPRPGFRAGKGDTPGRVRLSRCTPVRFGSSSIVRRCQLCGVAGPVSGRPHFLSRDGHSSLAWAGTIDSHCTFVKFHSHS